MDAVQGFWDVIEALCVRVPQLDFVVNANILKEEVVILSDSFDLARTERRVKKSNNIFGEGEREIDCTMSFEYSIEPFVYSAVMHTPSLCLLMSLFVTLLH